MELRISRVLGELIHHHYESFRARGKDCRLLVPGVTRRIAREVHAILTKAGVTTYLLVGENDEPCEESNHITPIGLTSKRIGSFVAIADPEQISHIQDSVCGTGGVVRSVVFSEEWPWVDEGSATFRFDGPVLRTFLRDRKESPEDIKWLTTMIRRFRLDSRASPARAKLFFEEVLGDDNRYTNRASKDIKEMLLYHAGVPRPQSLATEAAEIVERTNALCEKILVRYTKESDIRESLRIRARELSYETGTEALIRDLESFLDKLGKSDTSTLETLALHDCWTDTEHWRRLNAKVLAELFVAPTSRDEEVRLSAKYNVDECVGHAYPNRTLAVFYGCEFEVWAEYRIGAKINPEYKLQVLTRKKILREHPILEQEGRVAFTLNSGDDFPTHRSAVPLRVAIVKDNVVLTHRILRLHVCGPHRESFAVAHPPFGIVDARKNAHDDTDEDLSVNEPINLHLFAWNNQDVRVTDENNEAVEIEHGNRGWWSTVEPLDVAQKPDGEATRRCVFDDKVAVFFFRATDLPDNEFNIESAFVSETAQTRRPENFDRLFKIFDGESRRPYPALGNITGATQRRIQLADAMLEDNGHWVFLSDFLKRQSGAIAETDQYINRFGHVDGSEPLRRISLPEEAITLTQKYSLCRKKIVAHIRSSLDDPRTHTRHPLYATHPIFVSKNSADTEALLCDYLQAYRNIISYLEKEQSNLERGQLFAMSHLDNVVHWDNSEQRNRFFLVGPWHPVVLAKRFMVQSAIYMRARRKKHSPDGEEFARLAVLLRSIPGFRWVIGLSDSETKIEPAYTEPTSDPGWHFAISRGDLVDLDIKHSLVASFDISIHSERVGDGALIDKCIRNFHRAFPDRRRISMRIRSGYSNQEVVAAVNTLLHSPSDSEFVGAHLPGGVGLYFEDRVREIDTVQWDDPPIQIFTYDGDEDSENQCLTFGNPDIYFLPPKCRVTIRRHSTPSVPLPRGRGLESVFFHYLEWLTEGQTGLPSSISLEVDHAGEKSIPRDLGASFVETLSAVSGLFGIVPTTSTEVSLPPRLGAPWAVLPQYSISPSALVQYVKNSAERQIQNRVLWDYKFDIEGAKHAHYLLSHIPSSFPATAKSFFGVDDLPEKFIVELGCVGIAIGSEALRSGRHALGVIGLIGAVRLLLDTQSSVMAPLATTRGGLGFLIPIDSFPFFYERGESGAELRADLLAVRLTRPDNGHDRLQISACGIESKLVSSVYPHEFARRAMAQAVSSGRLFTRLVTLSLESGGTPERLALLELINFGLRISGPSDPQEKEVRRELERYILNSMLSGQYTYRDAAYKGVLVTTEGGEECGTGETTLDGGLWIKLTKRHWPGISETPQLAQLRNKLATLFGRLTIDSSPDEVPDNGEVYSQTKDEERVNEGSSDGTKREEEKSVPSSQTEDPKSSVPVVQRSVSSHLGRVLIGTDESRRLVYFDPQSQLDSLENSNMMITGSPGTGKTQFIKYLTLKIREQDRSVLIVDLKNDFASDGEFCSEARLSKIFVTFDGLPYNPLIPYPVKHPETNQEYIQCAQHIEGVSAVLKKVYSLGSQQQAAVKSAIHEAFNSSGIPSDGMIEFNRGFEFPDFASVGRTLEKTNPAAYNRLDPLFRLELFRPESKDASFERQIATPSVIDLSLIPSDEIKNVLAQLIVLSAHTYYNSRPHSGFLRQFLVFDEAHRVLGSDYILKFARECRAYGVCLILSSQYPTDFPDDVSASLATKILHGNGQDISRVKGIAQKLGCEGRESEISNLRRFEALVGNRQYRNILMRTMNYPLFLVWARLLELRVATFQQLADIKGIDSSKLHVEVLIKQLVTMGLASIDNGKIIAGGT